MNSLFSYDINYTTKDSSRDSLLFAFVGSMCFWEVTRAVVLVSFFLLIQKVTLKKSNVWLSQALFLILTMW